MGQPLTVLVVDDDPDDLEVFCDAIKETKVPVRCIECSDPHLVRKIVLQKALPDIMFLDLNMPGYTGFDLLKDLRSIPSLDKMKIAVLSTTVDGTSSRRVTEMGAQFALTKPATFQGYVDMLNSILVKL